MELKELFKKRFEKLYKGNRLLAIQLDGFTHCVIFDDGKSHSQVHKEAYSSFIGKEEAQMYGLNNERTSELFKGVSNSTYQNNATEIVYVLPNER
jgi:hypothetical protein